MFPHDVVANAPRIISDLRAIFPPQQGTFLIGPMAKLGWGTPTLVSLSLGVIIEIPGNVAILGVLQRRAADRGRPAARPAGELRRRDRVRQQARATSSPRCSTRASSSITLDGEMGALVAFGDDANLLVSVGGFHPSFTPPPLPFPSPKRIAISILDEDAARIRADAYFAVTTNTVQFGARAELYFGFSVVQRAGALRASTRCCSSRPFTSSCEISASVSLKAFGVGVFSVGLDFTLEGPTPWHVARQRRRSRCCSSRSRRRSTRRGASRATA